MTHPDIFKTGLDYPTSDVDAQAAYWFTVLQDENCTEAQRKAFSHWIAADDVHFAAYDFIVAALHRAADIADDTDILDLRREALGVGLGTYSESARWAFNSRRLAGLVAVFVAFICLVGFTQSLNRTAPAISEPNTTIIAQLPQVETGLTLVTEIGEQLTHTLADGSIVELNTNSEVRVQLDDKNRNVYLLKGQAVFNVAHDAERPFVVFAGDRRVTALGTTFEVRLDEQVAQVTLIEGKVKVDSQTLSDDVGQQSVSNTVELLPGQRYVSTAPEKEVVELQKIETELSWRDGRHIFEDEKIDLIVNELNRYTERKIILRDPKIGQLRASANFKIGSTQSLALALETRFGLALHHDDATKNIIIDWK